MTDTEKMKMLRGDPYMAGDEELVAERRRARELLYKLNVEMPLTVPGDYAEILRELMPNAKPPIWLQPPFYCDYGCNIHLGEHVFLNFNCVILDCAVVAIGARTQIGPNVQIYAADHPLDYAARAEAIEFSRPVSIGEDCWIGGNVVICPGVTVGDRCVIGAGAVVTMDVPDDALAVGNPARVIRTIDRSSDDRAAS
jgi:maltose O-acetyltransferase